MSTSKDAPRDVTGEICATEECQFCEKFVKGRRRHAIFDHVLWENDDLVVVPAIGGFVDGYVLLIPRHHERSMARLSRHLLAEVEDGKSMIRRALSAVFMPPIMFEHGPVVDANRSGACVDHVHLHCVPTHIDLLPILRQRHPFEELQRYVDIERQVLRAQSYIYYENQQERRFLFSDQGLPSQYLRRLLAQQLGYDGVEWDYAVFDFKQNVERTVQALSGAPWAS